jgi:uncharacterized protein (TIGR03435 family)
MSRLSTAVAIALVVIAAPRGAAQQPTFEAASIRPNTTPVVVADDQEISISPGGSLRVVNMPLRFLITFAYQMQGFQLDGGPDWVASDRFDIIGRAGQALPPRRPGGPDPIRLMLQALLEDRFKLALRKETRQMPIYELVLARRDGKPAPQLRPAQADCAALEAALAAGTPPPPPPPTGPGCGSGGRLGGLRFGGQPLTAFAALLSRLVQRVVVDRTGLPGNWELELTFSSDPSQLSLPPGVPPPPAAPNADPNGPSLFTALEEQLGLKLQPARGPVEVHVIDRVDRPTEN